MNDTVTTIIGSIAAVGTTFAWLPQVIRTCRTRSANDFSWGYLAMFASGVALWIVYGALRDDAVVILANVITLALVLMVLYVKSRQGARG